MNLTPKMSEETFKDQQSSNLKVGIDSELLGTLAQPKDFFELSGIKLA